MMWCQWQLVWTRMMVSKRLKNYAKGLKIHNTKNLVWVEKIVIKNSKFILRTFFKKSIRLWFGNVMSDGANDTNFLHWLNIFASPNVCLPDSCQNNGKCSVNGENSFECDCPKFWEGLTCNTAQKKFGKPQRKTILLNLIVKVVEFSLSVNIQRSWLKNNLMFLKFLINFSHISPFWISYHW